MKEKLKQLKPYHWIIISLAVIINIFILVNAFIKGGPSSKESGFVSDVLKNIINFFFKNAINEGNYDTFAHVVRKLIGHYSLFLLDGVFTSLTIEMFFLAENNKRVVYYSFITLGYGLFLALLTELIQIFVPGRVGAPLDILIDFLGYLTGSIIIIIILFIRVNKKDQSPKDSE